MYHSFLIHSSADGHLGCFHVLAIINSAAMNIGVHVSLSDLVSSVCMPRSGIAGSYGSSSSSFLTLNGNHNSPVSEKQGNWYYKHCKDEASSCTERLSVLPHPSGGLCQCWRDVDLTLLDPLIFLILSSLTLLPHQLVSRWLFPRLCLGVRSVYLLWSLTAFLFPEILGFRLPAAKIYVIFRCNLLLTLNPVLCPASCLPSWLWLKVLLLFQESKGTLLLVVYVASGPWFRPRSGLLYPLHIWACPRSARLGSSNLYPRNNIARALCGVRGGFCFPE